MSYLAANPKAGDVIKGTGGARKVRFAMPGKGKRGGYRTIHYYGGDDIPVFILAALSKSDRADISQAERNAMQKKAATLVDGYRESVRNKVRQLKET